MEDTNENFDALLRQKVSESQFKYEEAYWLKAESMITKEESKKTIFSKFIRRTLLLLLLTGVTTLIWQWNSTMQENSSITKNQKVHLQENQASSDIRNQPATPITQVVQEHSVISENSVAAPEIDLTTHPVSKASPVLKNKIQNLKKSLNSTPQAENEKFGQELIETSKKVLQQNNTIEIASSEGFELTNSNESVFAQEESSLALERAQPNTTIIKNSGSARDIDPNIVAACDNQNKTNWMYAAVAGIGSSRGFEGNGSGSKNGLALFIGYRMAYKIDKNWFVGLQPLIYSRGAVNTNMQSSKTEYDFGQNADEFIVHNKSLVFAELPLLIGYRVHHHQVSVGFGAEYLINVKSDVKEFGSQQFEPNQWGYVSGFNRFGSIAAFNYAFNVYNEFWINLMLQKGFTDLTKENYFPTNNKDRNFNMRIGVQYLFQNNGRKVK